MTRARDLADYIAQGVSTTELDILDGLTTTTAELNILDGVTATTAELNYVDGVTSSIQAQMNNLAGSATIAVTVVNSGGNKYALDGTVQQLALLTPSVTYRFDQSNSSNSGHPLRLSTTSDGSHGGGSAFTTGVTAVGTPGNAGAYTEVKLEQDAPDTLYYYCTNHSGMGGEVDVRATVSSLSDLSITSTATELNLLDGVTATTAELNILDGVTSTAAELNILDGVTATAAELNALDGITAVVGELNALDIGSTAVGTAVASKAVILDSNKDYTGIRNLTISGELDAATLDVSGNVDVDGVLETDNLTIGGAQGSDGQVLTSTGSGVGWESVPQGGFTSVTTITSSATYTIPSGITKLLVHTVGGGGGGCGYGGSPNGLGGTGGTTSVASGNESITTISATGGNGGGPSNTANGGNGGIGSNGDLNIRGNGGQPGNTSGRGSGGGGSSHFGGGARGSHSSPSSTNGFGGGGGGYAANNANQAGGGGGGTAIKLLTGVTPGNTLAVTIGAAGAAGDGEYNDGAAGGAGLVFIQEYK